MSTNCRTPTIIGNRCPQGSSQENTRPPGAPRPGLGRLRIPQGQRCWRANVFLPHIRVDHGDALTGLQTAPGEKATIRALTAINATKDEDFAPFMPHNLVCRPVPGWGNIERWLHSAAPGAAPGYYVGLITPASLAG